MSKVVLFLLIFHLNAKVNRAIVKIPSVCEYFVHEETSEWVWVFYWREKNCKSEYFCSFLRASKIQRGFSARATQNFGDKKESKTATFGIKKRRGKKNLWWRQPSVTEKLFCLEFPILWVFSTFELHFGPSMIKALYWVSKICLPVLIFVLKVVDIDSIQSFGVFWHWFFFVIWTSAARTGSPRWTGLSRAEPVQPCFFGKFGKNCL